MAASFESLFFASVVRPEGLTVMKSHVSFMQPKDKRGRPTAGARSGLVRLTLLGNDKAALTNWAMDSMKAIKGRVEYKDTIGGTLRTLMFVDGYCVEYKETLIAGDGAAAYQFDIGITARQITMDDSLHDNMWSDWKPGER